MREVHLVRGLPLPCGTRRLTVWSVEAMNPTGEQPDPRVSLARNQAAAQDISRVTAEWEDYPPVHSGRMPGDPPGVIVPAGMRTDA